MRVHAEHDDMKYVPPSLLAEWTQKDPIALFEAHLLSRGLASQTDLDSVRVMIDRSLEADLDRSASGFAAWLAADQTSPSGRAERNEELLRMIEALAELPDLMREVVVLKHCQGLTLQQIGERIGKSVPAVASLLRRGLAELRTRLKAGG